MPVVRHICGDALRKLGVSTECVGDIELAVTEACTNVLDHTRATADDYEVSVEIDEQTCAIRVIDTGTGFDFETVGKEAALGSAESGRGIFLMRSVVDDLKFVSQDEKGTMVHLTKKLDLAETSLLRMLNRTADGDGTKLAKS